MDVFEGDGHSKMTFVSNKKIYRIIYRDINYVFSNLLGFGER